MCRLKLSDFWIIIGHNVFTFWVNISNREQFELNQRTLSCCKIIEKLKKNKLNVLSLWLFFFFFDKLSYFIEKHLFPSAFHFLLTPFRNYTKEHVIDMVVVTCNCTRCLMITKCEDIWLHISSLARLFFKRQKLFVILPLSHFKRFSSRFYLQPVIVSHATKCDA